MKILTVVPHWLGGVAVMALAAGALGQVKPATEPSAKGVEIPVHFTAPGKGYSSLALYDESGVLVRSLLYAQPVEAGNRQVLWDGATDLGMPAKPGKYTARGIFFTEQPSLKYVMKVGKSGNPPWRTRDGRGDWGGNLGGPAAICSNGKSIMMVWSCVEDNQITGIQQMDNAGNIKMRYYSFYPWDTRMAGAMDETNFYLGILNGQKKQIEIAEYKLGEPRGRILAALPTQPHKETGETRWNGRWTAWLDGLALTPERLYASNGADDALFILDRATGKILKQIQLPSPRGLAISNGHLLVVSGKKVLRLSLDGKVQGTVVNEGVLGAPNALAVDGEGRLYVGDGGSPGVFGTKPTEGARQVFVFSPQGKLLHKIGKEGGAPLEGHFQKDALGSIASLCIGTDDKTLWVQDTATGFPRTSRWSTEGQLQQQWFTRTLTLWSDVVNPAKPNELLLMNDGFSDAPGISAYSMDLAAGTWQPSWHYNCTWADMFQEDAYLSFTHGGNPLNGIRGKEARWPVFVYSSRHPVRGPNGKDYFMQEGGNGDGAIFTYSADHKPRRVALVGYHRSQLDAATGKIESIYDQGPNNWFTWADRDGDGNMATDELTYTPNLEALAQARRVSQTRLDKDLNVFIRFWAVDAKGKPYSLDKVLPVKEILPNGAPVYDWSMLKDALDLQPPDLNGGDGTKKVAVYNLSIPLERPEGLYSMVEPSPETKLELPGIDGKGWWASRNWRTKLARFDKTTGRCMWAVGRRAPALAQPGQMYHPCYLAGEAGGDLFVTDTLGPVWVWNTDGLYVGHLFHDYNSGIEDDQALYGEIQATEIYTDPTTGKIYSIANDTGAFIHEVSLPKLTPVTGQAVTLTAEQAAQVKPWDPDGPGPGERPRYDVAFTPKAPAIDGNLFTNGDPWFHLPSGVNVREMTVLLDGKRIAGVRALYDRENLYLAYDVRAPHGPINSGSELPFAPFVSGAYVDFDLGTHWSGTRRQTQAGDLRVILAQVRAGSGIKAFQQAFWPVKENGQRPRTIQSPAAQAHFDDIGELPGLKMAYKVDKPDAKEGIVPYSVEVSVPLASLGLNEPAGKTVGFDASVGVANAAGDRRERATHWGGLSEGVVVDRPGSAALLPETWGSLTFLPASPAADQ